MKHIEYRGYFNGKGDRGGMTPLYDTEAEALASAKQSCTDSGDTAWANPVYMGPIDVTMRATEEIKYFASNGATQGWKTIPAGSEFCLAEYCRARA